jgi:ABC-type nitrate/sulfonate/bicarbonate transport system substrate-binding protein
VSLAAITAAFAIPWFAKGGDIPAPWLRRGTRVYSQRIEGGSDVVGGSIDVFAPAAPACAKLAGADTVYIAIPVNRVLVFTVAEPHVQRVEELRGKSIGVTRIGTVTDFFTRIFLRQNGLVPDRDVMIRQMGGLPEIVAGLKAGQIQSGTFGFRRSASPRRRVSRFGRLQRARLPYPLSSVIVTEKLLRARESAVRSFLEAHIEAGHRFKTDPNFAMSVIGKYTSTADRSMLEETQRVYASSFERIPYPNVEDMKLGITQVAETNPRAKGADPKDFVDGRLLRE